jgi:uncharacterized membrane protein
MRRIFVLSDVLRVAWKGYMSQVWLLTGLLIGYDIISLALNLFFPSSLLGTISMAGMAIALLSLVFSLLFSLGYTKNMFQALDGEEPQFAAYAQEARKIFTGLFAGLIFTVLFVVGLVLLLLPGFYIAIRLQFFYASIVEEDSGIISSLKRSWEITKGQEKQLFVLLLVEISFILIGLICFVIGIFIAAPYIGLMNCYVFRRLTAITTEEISG